MIVCEPPFREVSQPGYAAQLVEATAKALLRAKGVNSFSR
jgi:16S rRNA G1207 methylase RsmC